MTSYCFAVVCTRALLGLAVIGFGPKALEWKHAGTNARTNLDGEFSGDRARQDDHDWCKDLFGYFASGVAFVIDTAA